MRILRTDCAHSPGQDARWTVAQNARQSGLEARAPHYLRPETPLDPSEAENRCFAALLCQQSAPAGAEAVCRGCNGLPLERRRLSGAATGFRWSGKRLSGAAMGVHWSAGRLSGTAMGFRPGGGALGVAAKRVRRSARRLSAGTRARRTGVMRWWSAAKGRPFAGEPLALQKKTCLKIWR